MPSAINIIIPVFTECSFIFDDNKNIMNISFLHALHVKNNELNLLSLW